MSEHSPEKQRQFAVQVAAAVSTAEKEALRLWIERLLEIRASNLPVARKAKEAILLTASSGLVVPVAKLIGREITPEGLEQLTTDLLIVRQSQSSALWKLKEATSLIARQIKALAWDDRGLKGRLAIAGAVSGVVLFGGQSAGIAALGTAIGVPLWVVFGAGAAFAGVLYEEITGRKPDATSYTVIDANRKDQE